MDDVDRHQYTRMMIALAEDCPGDQMHTVVAALAPVDLELSAHVWMTLARRIVDEHLVISDDDRTTVLAMWVKIHDRWPQGPALPPPESPGLGE